MTLAQKAEVLAALGCRPAGGPALHAAVARLAARGVRPRGAARGAGRARRRRGRVVPLRPRAGGRRGGPRGARRGARLLGATPLPPVLERGRPGQQQPRARRRSPRGTCARRAPCSGGRTSWTARWCGATGAGARSASRPRTSTPENEILPARGVYAGAVPAAATARWPRRRWSTWAAGPPSAAGTSRWRPTCIDFEGDLYGARVRLEFHERLRDEQRFHGAGGPRRPDPARTSRRRAPCVSGPARREGIVRGAAGPSMSELTVDTPRAGGDRPPLPAGLHQRPHRPPLRGRDPEGARRRGASRSW